MKSNALKFFATAVLLVLSVCGSALSAQNVRNPIRWRTGVQMTSPTEGVITLRAIIDDGWHLYGFELPDDGPRPTTIDLSGSPDIELTGPVAPQREPLTVADEMFGVELVWWDSDVLFTVPFHITGDAPVVKGTISFMACNDVTCQPPTTVQVSMPVRKTAHAEGDK